MNPFIKIDIEKKLGAPSGEMLLRAKLEIQKGSLLTLYGNSGAGKTSLLRMLAGLLHPDAGQISVNDQTWFNSKKRLNLPPQKRGIGFLFQDYALFPNMTVRENLLFALGKKGNKKPIEELIEIMKLGELQNQRPDTLSGGQKQRVALARSLVQKPEILLLDEPLSALDNQMRHTLQQYILQVHREFELTTMLVSHDISEILKMSDSLMELENGEIIKQGSPAKIFGHHEVSGKFQFTGEIVGIEKQDFIYILSILIGKEVVKVVADEAEAQALSLGDKVLVASKAFNPIIKKL
ncbi:ATP-binding cassette domain-containing protein [Flammeovirgaceae bacterium SG7u.111]|nr:ATP-binding cassette domain-containing protein [Flammeovirgaceae bacterium SG7u.132]WPO36183.1 ATP-binding cassette domain-containing protein [Flammeovirgaceae bacterium SG7u.111]